jgi:hypothetical protein
VEQPRPDLWAQRKELTIRLDAFLSSYKKRAVNGHYLVRIREELNVDTASEEELNRIKNAIETVSSREGAARPTSAQKAAKA